MRSHEKSTMSIMRLFNQECSELCYNDFIPKEVDRARRQLRASMSEGPTEMEKVKSKLMKSLRETFFAEDKSFDISQASYLANGEKRLV